MAYLTFSEFGSYINNDMDETTFNEYSDYADTVLDHVTQFFYMYNDLETDIEFRKEQFKKAVAAQINYFNSIGMTNFNSLANVPRSFSVGRTSISSGDGRSDDKDNEMQNMIAKEVYLYLEGTGLLYRGAGS